MMDHAASRESASHSTTPQISLLKLPREIILQIVQGYLEHESLENFANCCKDVRHISNSILASHLALKRKFNTLAAGDLEDYKLKPPSNHSPHLASLIANVLHNKDISRYTRRLILGPTVDSDNPDYCEESCAEEEAICVLQKNKEALRAQVTCVPGFQTLEGWLDKVYNGERHVIGQRPFYNSTLLELLPHLQELVLVGQAARHVPFGIEDYIEVCIAPIEEELFQEFPNQAMPSGLQNLKKVNLVGIPRCGISVSAVFTRWPFSPICKHCMDTLWVTRASLQLTMIMVREILRISVSPPVKWTHEISLFSFSPANQTA
ncbi:MAG: hypothetical protein Q9180_005249 [Flavoplaca navasiana]